MKYIVTLLICLFAVAPVASGEFTVTIDKDLDQISSGSAGTAGDSLWTSDATTVSLDATNSGKTVVMDGGATIDEGLTVGDYVYFGTDGEKVGSPEAGAVETASRGAVYTFTDTNDNGAADSPVFKIFTGITGVAGITNASAIFDIEKQGNCGIGDYDPDAMLEVSASAGASDLLKLSSNDDTDGDILTVLNNGNVGIGTSSPESTLHLRSAGTPVMTLQRSGSTANADLRFAHDDGEAFIGLDANNNFAINDVADLNSSPVATFDVSSGNVGIFDTTPDALLEVSASAGASDLLKLSSNDDTDGDLFVVKNNGNVGIGTVTPTAALEVVGDVVSSGEGTFSGVNITGTTAGTISSPNDISLTSNSGAGTIQVNGDITASGTLSAGINTLSVSGNTTLTAAQCLGTTVYCDGAATITLPAIAAGMSVEILTIGAAAISVDPNVSDKLWLEGTALDDGDKASNLTVSGDVAVFKYFSADGWYVASNSWTDGGA